MHGIYTCCLVPVAFRSQPALLSALYPWAVTHLDHITGLQGATATVSLRQPRTEAHLSQLAVLENFAEHGLYVKFSNQEAEELEREALALALEESTQEVGTDRCVTSFSCCYFMWLDGCLKFLQHSSHMYVVSKLLCMLESIKCALSAQTPGQKGLPPLGLRTTHACVRMSCCQ